MPYKPCSINEMGLKLHIVNEKLGEIHHGIVSITESIPANEYNFYLHIDRSTSFRAHWCIYFRIHSNVRDRRYGGKMDAEEPISVCFISYFLGMLFPGCECGIVPIVRRLIGKGVPPYAGIAFMLTGPIINPVVLFATYVAFGSSMHMVWYRSIVAIIVAIIVGIILSFMFKEHQLRDDHFPEVNNKRPLRKKCGMYVHTLLRNSSQWENI